MASTIDITCPHCTKLMKGPETLQGKKIRCKSCGEAFTVPAASAQSETFTLKDEPASPKKSARPSKPPAKAAPPPAAKKPPADDDDEEGGNYGLSEGGVASRCPHCACAMEEGQRICLECGYDTRARLRHGSKKTYETTGGDVAMWLLPGIVCVFVALGCCVSDIVSVIVLPGMLDRFAEEWWEKPEKPTGFFNFCSLWLVIGSFAIIVPCIRFAVKRLIYNYTPPEVEKK